MQDLQSFEYLYQIQFITPVDQLTQFDWNFLKTKGICNGFGPSSWKVLNFILNRVSPAFNIASADIHDLNYFRWGTEADRKKADEWFLKYMLLDCQNFTWIKRIYYTILAYMYFWAVRIWWKKYFQYK